MFTRSGDATSRGEELQVTNGCPGEKGKGEVWKEVKGMEEKGRDVGMERVRDG